MSFSLTSIAATLTAVSSAAQASETIFKFGALLIADAEAAYEGVVGSGATKKAAVMAVLESVCKDLGESWDAIKAQISAWIDLVIAAYRSAQSLFGTADKAVVATADAAKVTESTAAADPFATSGTAA